MAATVLAVLLAFAPPQGVHASESLTVGAQPVDLAGHLEVLEDPRGELTFEEVAFGAAARRFVPVPGNYNGGQARPGAAWIRFTIRGDSALGERFRILDMGIPNLDEVRIFMTKHTAPAAAEDFTHLVVGTQHPYSERPIPSPRFLIPIEVGTEPMLVILRVKTRFAMVLEGRVAGVEDIVRSGLARWLFVGGYISACLLITGINLAFWYWLRDRFYLFYAIFALSLVPTVLWAKGLLSALFPELGGVIGLPVRGLGVGIGVTAGFAFLASFLPFRQTSPLAYRSTLLLSAVGPLFILVAMLDEWSFAYIPITLCLLLCVPPLWETLRLAFVGDARARMYLLSFMPANLAIFAVIGRDAQLLPANALIANSYEIGGLVHLILMTVGFGYRIREAERDRLRAEKKALRVAQTASRRASELVERRTAELAAAKAQLEEALDAERSLSRQQLQFIDTISHEYRTPVAVLRTNLDLLQMAINKKVALPDTTLARMRAAIARLTEIIEVSLSGSRITAGSLMPSRRQVSLHLIVEDAVGAAEDMHPEREIRYVPSAEAVGLNVDADAAMLKTVVVNLLDNAHKYSPAGTPISVELARQGKAAALKVIDSGRGIAKKDLPYVFEKYFRARGSSERPGAGIGLHLVQRIVSAHDGKVALASSSAGTTVTVVLPLHDAASANPPGPAPVSS